METTIPRWSHECASFRRAAVAMKCTPCRSPTSWKVRDTIIVMLYSKQKHLTQIERSPPMVVYLTFREAWKNLFLKLRRLTFLSLEFFSGTPEEYSGALSSIRLPLYIWHRLEIEMSFVIAVFQSLRSIIVKKPRDAEI